MSRIESLTLLVLCADGSDRVFVLQWSCRFYVVYSSNYLEFTTERVGERAYFSPRHCRIDPHDA
jgi:hypothetical protein